MPINWTYLTPIALLVGSNVFMTTAWYWHLRYKEVPLISVIFISWALAFVEYWMAVPANRWGSDVYSAAQLKTMQEVITLLVFAGFLLRLFERAADLEPGFRFRADHDGRVLRVSQAIKFISPESRVRFDRRHCR